MGHARIDSTAIEGRKKACRIAEKKPKIKKKRGRKSKAEKEAMLKAELEEIHTRRLALQGGRTLEANLEDLPQVAIGAESVTAREMLTTGEAINCIFPLVMEACRLPQF